MFRIAAISWFEKRNAIYMVILVTIFTDDGDTAEKEFYTTLFNRLSSVFGRTPHILYSPIAMHLFLI